MGTEMSVNEHYLSDSIGTRTLLRVRGVIARLYHAQ